MQNISTEMTAWAKYSSGVSGLVLIGSRQKSLAAPLHGADQHSDWDFQIITGNLQKFSDETWLAFSSMGKPLAYVYRKGILGQANKVTVVWNSGEADFVIIPKQRLMLAKVGMLLGLHHRTASVQTALGSLAVVIRSGFTFLHGARNWEGFYRRVIAEVKDPRLNDAQILAMANGFVCDYVWIRSKIVRGELLAAQRMLHASLIEANFKLQHELRQRLGMASLPDARRAEWVLELNELDALTISSSPDAISMDVAISKVAQTFRELMNRLIPGNWHWPL